MKKFSVQNLLDWLEVKGLLQNRSQAESYLLCEKNVTHHTFYLKILMDLTGLAAFGLLMVFLFSGFVNNIDINHFQWSQLAIGSMPATYSLMIFGLGLMLLGWSSYYFTKHYSDLIQSVSFSFALFCMLTGKILFLTGLSLLAIPLTPILKIVLGLAFIVPLCYVYFPLAINRFLSSLALLFCIMISLMSNSLIDFHFAPNIGFLIYYLLLVLLVTFMFTWKNKPISMNPFAYAGVVMLCLNAVSLSFLYENNANAAIMNFKHIPTLYFDLTLGVILIAQCLYYSGGWQKIYELPVLCTVIALGILSLITNNGILLSISLLMMSYGKHERALCILSSLFLFLFLIEYYTQLPATLTYKAVLLIGSGVMLLFIRWVMKYEHWD